MEPAFVIPRLLIELVLPGINESFKRENYNTLFSEITPASASSKPEFTLIIERLNEVLNIGIEISGAGEIQRKKIEEAVKEAVKETAFIIQLISGREIKNVSVIDKDTNRDKSNIYQFTIALIKDEEEIFLIFSIPGRFFNIMIPSLDTSYIRADIADLLIVFFKKPDILYPSIKLLLVCLESSELSGLLDLLKRNNLLSDYQLVLLINGFSEYSLKIKNALSRNTQDSLREELKKYKGKVTKVDIACGVYSVEEGISQVLKKEKNRIAEYLRRLSSLIKKITDYELYMRKSWQEWIDEMDQKKLLYKTLLKCSDQILFNAFPGYRSEKYPFFARNFPASRIDEIFNGGINRISGTTAEARAAIIKNYRKLTVEALRYNDKDFSFILASIDNIADFEIIVRNTGWFILSTALKQCSRKMVDHVLSGVNYPARELIKGVISGTINPDIIHDEIQVNRARNESVRVMMELYEDGIIGIDI
jgi:hypothetical protein